MLGNNSRICLFLSLILSVIMLTGCWNRKEVNEIAFVTAAAIDKKGENVLMSVSFLRPKKGHEPGEPNIVTLKTEGKTVFEAIRLLNLTLPRKAYWSHAYAILLSKEIAREGLLKHIDFFRRDHEIRSDIIFLITDKPEQVLMLKPKMEVVLARGLKNTAKGGMDFAGIPVFSTLHEVSKMLYSKSPYAAVSHVSVDEKKKKYLLDGISFFRKDRMVGTVKGKDVSGWQWITGGIKSAIIPIPCNSPKKQAKGNLSIEINKASSKLGVIRENGKLTLKVKIKAKANVGENECGVDLSKEEEYKKIEKLTSEEVKKLVKKMLDYAQKTIKTDIFGFGAIYYQKYPHTWKPIKDDWNELFSAAKKEIKVEVKVIGSGLIFTETIGE